VDEPEIDRLYALPLEEFTPARDALAARLRTAGDAAEAARIKALRKPTAPAWAVNQLARAHRDQIEALVAASDRLRSAQHDLLSGGPAGDVWEATLVEREIAGRLVDAAELILRNAGYGASRSALERVADTLYAAAADPSGRTLLRKGQITTEMRRAGFGEIIDAPPSARGAGARATAPKRKPAKLASVKPAPKQRGGPTARELLEAEREAERLARDAGRASSEAVRLTRDADRAADDANATRKRAETAAKAATEAREEAADAKRSAADAKRAADRAAARLEKLRSRA